MPSKDNMIKSINSTMPQEAVEDLDAAMGKCIDEQGNKITLSLIQH